MAQNVADILGVPLEMAENLLAAAGGDEALAIDLGLGGGDAFMAPTAASFQAPYPQYARIWPELTDIPAAWTQQRLDARVSSQNDDCRLTQGKNGPCGVLAVVQATLWTLPTATTPMSFDDKLTQALEIILQRVVDKNANQTAVTLTDGTQISVTEAAKQIRTATALVEAVALTAGVDTQASGTTLVEGPHWLCSVDLMCLLLRGFVGKGHVRAWDDETKQKLSFYDGNDNNPIGLLSYSELEEGMKLADDLKFNKNVWVLHTGDHFITMRRLPVDDDSDNKMVRLQVYDGLPPAGPKSTTYQITGDLTTASPATQVYAESFTKKRVGQADDIVQAKKTDSLSYKDWTFEVVPAVEDPTVEGPLDDDPNEPVYEFPQPADVSTPWRCASCYYTRFKTMNFGLNESGAVCASCQKPRSAAMWSLWQSFAELSPQMQKRARRMYAPRLELVLSTLWPQAIIGVVEDETA